MAEPHALPDDLVVALGVIAWEPETIGASGAGVWRGVRVDGTACYLKVAGETHRAEMAHEHALLAWLHGKLPVPDILLWRDDGARAYLATAALPGIMSCDQALDAALAIDLLAAGLRQIHALPSADCPFDQRLATKLEIAHTRVVAGLVDVEDFDLDRLEDTPTTIYQRLLAERPTTEDLVFTHGDYCLPNILIDPAARLVTGLVDWGRGGVADRYQDLALADRSIRRNWGDAWVAPFFAAYGLPHPDAHKIAYYQLLDELF
jgi:aminoglycoside 3'-phosphotransferase-2